MIVLHIEKRIEELGLSLYEGIKPIGSYVPFVKVGNVVYISGQGPSIQGEYTDEYKGKVGDNISEEKAYEAARLTAVNLVSILKSAVGDLDKVKQIISVHGYVNSTSGFEEQPFVINGASDLLVEIFGDRGKHSRCAMSVYSLPLGICVEVELIALVED